MKFELPPLPYAKNALEPHMGRETLEVHYEKHHRGYLEKLHKALTGKPEADRTLEEIIKSSEGSVFNNAAQVWNHTFFWNCMQPKGGGRPGGEIGRRLTETFGSFEKFRDAFIDTGKSRFGSGYVWLVLDQGRVRCVSTLNAENPFLMPRASALLGCDVWEHAYYLDYRNERAKYLDVFLKHLVNWDFVDHRLQKVA